MDGWTLTLLPIPPSSPERGASTLVNLVDHTTRSYQPEGVTAMWAVAEDRHRNTFLGSYWKYTYPLIFEMGILEIKLPSPVPEITSLIPAESPQGSDSQIITITGKKFITASNVFMDNKYLAGTFIDNNRLDAVIPAEMLANAGVFPVTILNPEPQGGVSHVYRPYPPYLPSRP